ncbi:hypothetical protein BC350_06085 [Ralstonia pseudosolanacearum]|nr:hypothetical protein BC350_06085 [Ralstonia pseudosolanacearum]
MLMLSLWPFIDYGIVHVVPDIGDFNFEFAQSSHKAAEARTAGVSDIIAREDTPRLALLNYKTLIGVNRMSEKALTSHFKRERPNSSPELIAAMVAATKEMIAQDPYALLQPAGKGERGCFLFQKGFALESGVFFAALTGSVLYTDYHSLWQHAHRDATEHQGQTARDLRVVVEACQSIAIPVDVDAQALLRARESGQFERWRAVMRDIVSSARQHHDSARMSELAVQLEKAREGAEAESATMANGASLRVLASFPIGGFHRPAIWRHLLTFGQAHHIRPIPAAFLLEFAAELPER